MTAGEAPQTPRVDRVLDVREAKCPGPILKAREALAAMAVGEVLRVEATDPGSVLDFQGWAKASKAVGLLRQETLTEPGGRTVYVHYLEKRA